MSPKKNNMGFVEITWSNISWQDDKMTYFPIKNISDGKIGLELTS